jgi:predicted RecA/RadA family phage recombinase
MATNYSHDGEIVTLTAPGGGVTSGTPVKIGAYFGVPIATAAAAASFALAIEGVFDLPKATGVVAEGALLYWDATAETVSTSGDGPAVAVAELSALSGAATVRAKLQPAALADARDDYAQDGKFRAVWDATAGKAIGSHLFGPEFPDNSRVTNSLIEVITTFETAGADAGTIGVGFNTDDAGGLVTPIAVSDGSNPWDAGMQACIQDGGLVANVAEKLTAARQLEAVVAVQNVTAGKFLIWGDYVLSE